MYEPRPVQTEERNKEWLNMLAFNELHNGTLAGEEKFCEIEHPFTCGEGRALFIFSEF